MDCRDCSLLNAETGACRSGKLNPRTKEDATDIVRMIGIRALCIFNEHREPIVQRMYDIEIKGRILSEWRGSHNRHRMY